MSRLTDSKCRAAVCPPHKKCERLSDVGGLYLDVQRGGTKTWRALLPVAVGPRPRVSFGTFPDVSLSQARLLCAQKKIDVENERKSGITAEQRYKLSRVAEMWMEKWRVGKALVTVDKAKSYLNNRLLPALGNVEIRNIRASDVSDLVVSIEAEGFPEAARKVLDLVKQILRYALVRGYIESSPIAHIRPLDLLKSAPHKNFARLEIDEMKGFFAKLSIYNGRPTTRLAVIFLAHTFVRTHELRLLRWRWVNLETAEIEFPPEVMKTRKKHWVPLSSQMLELLDLAREATDIRYGEKSGRPDDLVFPGDGDSSTIMSENTVLKVIATLGYKGLMTGHGFRGIASTFLNEAGFRHLVIEQQLSHVQEATAAAYNHAEYKEERRAMMQHWSDVLAAVASGVVPKRATPPQTSELVRTN